MSFALLTGFLACLGMASALYESPMYGQFYPTYNYQSQFPTYYRNTYDSYYLSPYNFGRQEPAAAAAEPASNHGAAPSGHYISAVAAPVKYYESFASHEPCPGLVPEIKPIIIQTQKPVPFTYGLPLTPKVIEHHAAPNVINYYQSPYVIKHHQSALVNAYTQKPVIVDSYTAPSVHEAAGPEAIIVQEVCPPEVPVAVPAAEGNHYPAPAGRFYQ